MSNAATHVVTGGTGLVGAALILELLDATDDEVFAIVRGSDDAMAQHRLDLALQTAAEDFGRVDLIPDIEQRVRAVAGDILEPGCAVDAARLPRITQLWHSAASLRYEDAYADEIYRLNVGGTQHVLDLVRDLGGPQLNYVSTCYTAGRRTGLQYEEVPETTEWANNHYEVSKIRAERLVAGSGFDWRILRPSIVVGHSGTAAVTTFSGMYGFASALMKFRERVAEVFAHMMRYRNVTLLCDPVAELNFVPVDLVARNGVQVGLRGPVRSVYHLSNAESPSTQQFMDIAFPWAGLRPPRLTSDRRELTGIDELLDGAMEFYGSYFHHSKTFDLTNTEAVVGQSNTGAPMGQQRLRELLDWYRLRISADGRNSFPAKVAFAYTEPVRSAAAVRTS
ncbi:SDR family oxidoreductase [Nocardia sp. NPDC051321]|uniref:SDR family oxidoreductase n=1 Tax=Nocardia sp. NPDC051321 TaxID=3364323 RepID=UPI0037A136B4